MVLVYKKDFFKLHTLESYFYLFEKKKAETITSISFSGKCILIRNFVIGQQVLCVVCDTTTIAFHN